MKFRQRLKKIKKQNHDANHVEKEKKQLLLLDGAIKKLVDYEIAIIKDGKYAYSSSFERTAQDIISSPPGRLTQIRLAKEAGHKLIPEILAMATTKTTRRDIENMLTAYVCLKTHIKEHNLEIDKKILPDLTFAVWYLNDNEPTVQEVEEWNLTSQNK